MPWCLFENREVHDFDTGVAAAIADIDAPIEVYNLRGVKVADSTDTLPAGVYIVRQGRVVRKIVVK